jgi:hypothetical protein
MESGASEEQTRDGKVCTARTAARRNSYDQEAEVRQVPALFPQEKSENG